MLISHIGHFLEAWNVSQNPQRGTTRQRRHSWKVYENLEEMVMATVLIGDYVQTIMGRQAASQAATWGLLGGLWTSGKQEVWLNTLSCA